VLGAVHPGRRQQHDELLAAETGHVVRTRKALPITAATSTSTRSPVAWPWQSLIFLK
jgi:hypothetical protein